MGLTTQKPNYSIAGGDTLFQAVQLEEAAAAIQIQYSGINSADVELYLEQSIDNVNFNAVPGSNVILDQTKPSHLFNLTGKKGLFIRVGLKAGTATAGIIDTILYLI
jgi:hypothetical protein